jgi:hypothetical protein
LSWWAGNGGTTDRIGPNAGTLNNGVTFAQGEVSSAFQFHNTDYVSANTTGLPTGNSDRTLEMWVKVNTFGTSETYFGGYGAFGTGNGTYHLGTLSDHRLFFSQWGQAIVGTALLTGRWYHIAVTNIGHSATLYLNGLSVATGTLTIDTPQNTSFYLGRIPGTLGDGRQLDGMVDEVSVYRRALSATEIQGIYQAGSDGKIPPVVVVDFPSVVEGSTGTTTPVTFTITRPGSLSGSLTVNWATADGTATLANSDYVAASGQVIFADGEATKTIQVTVNGDNVIEPDETFKLVVTPVGSASNEGVATILGDDVGVAIGNDTGTEGDTSIRSLGAFLSAGQSGLTGPYAMIIGPDGLLYVSANTTGSGVYRFDAATGLPVPAPGKSGAEFVTPGDGGLSLARDIAFGPDGYLYVVSEASDAVLRYDPATGAFASAFIPSGSGGLDAPRGLTFKNGYAYVTSVGGTTAAPGKDSVLRYDAATGATAGVSGLAGDAVFISSGSGGLDNPSRVVFGTDGKAYVSSTASVGTSTTTNSVLRYDGTTGAPAGVSGQTGDAMFVSSGSGGLDGPIAMVFRPDGYLYVTSWRNNAVLRYQTSDGAFVGTVVLSGGGGLSFPVDLLFEASGNFLVTNKNTNQVLRFGTASQLAFTVSLTQASAGTTTVDYTTADGSTLSGSDYVAVSSGTLAFGPGETSKTIIIQTVDNTDLELPETFAVNLSNPIGGTISTSQGTGTILDNDTKFYVVNDASTDKTYEYAVDGNAGESYNLGSGNMAPRGAAASADGKTIWVVDSNKTVYVYDPTGALLGSWTAGGMTGSAQIEGIATSGADIWLLDNFKDKVYKFTGAASLRSGSQNAASSFSLNSGNANGKGIVTDGSSFWIVDDGSTDKVFKYNVSGSYQGSWTITAGGGSPTGITLNPTAPSHLWVVDTGTDRVYQYDNAVGWTSGSHPASTSFALAAGNTNPQDIADPPTADMLLTLAASPPALNQPSAAAVIPSLTSRDAAFASLAREPLQRAGELLSGGAITPFLDSLTPFADLAWTTAGALGKENPLDPLTFLKPMGSQGVHSDSSVMGLRHGTLSGQDSEASAAAMDLSFAGLAHQSAAEK